MTSLTDEGFQDYYRKRRIAQSIMRRRRDRKTKPIAATESLEEAIRKTKEDVNKIAKEHRAQNLKFRDRDFDLFVDRNNCLYSYKKASYTVTNVKRLTTILKTPKFFDVKIGPDGKIVHNSKFGPDDIRQGDINNCWFLASLAVIADVPRLLETICVARDEKVGVYGFIFFKDGDWVSAIIDDQLFTNGKDEKGNSSLTFAKLPLKKENVTWVPLIEKAFAKIHGDYESIGNGFTGQGMEDLTGGVYTSMFTSDILDKDEFWNNQLSKVENKTVLFACARYDDADLDTKGTSRGHAYSILSVKEIKENGEIVENGEKVENGENVENDENVKTIKLLLIRNPWGKSFWSGAWSDGSEEWTAERIKALNYKFGNNGSFWMTYDDFFEYWDVIDKCRLFDETWTVNLSWINYNVSPRSDGKFIITVDEKGPLVIVLQQPDNRYSCEQPKFKYRLSFRVYEEGKNENDYLYESRLTFPYGPRSTNLEITLEAGNYEVIPHVDRTEIKNDVQSGNSATKTTETNVEKLDAEKNKLKPANKTQHDEEGEWEMSLGLRLYSQSKSISLEGVQGDFPKKEGDEKKEKERKRTEHVIVIDQCQCVHDKKKD